MARDIATMVVTVALRHFRDEVLVPGIWDPSRGASLSTFFVGQCILRYGNEFKAWKRQHLRSTKGDDLARFERGLDVADAGTRVVDQAVIDEYLDGVEPTTVRALTLYAADYSWEEIAELTGISVSAIRGRVTRFQARSRRREMHHEQLRD